MSRSALVDVFVEDRAHEELLRPLLARVAAEEGCAAKPRIRCARGGSSRAIDEMRFTQDLIASATMGIAMPDVFLVGIDGNCTTSAKKRGEIRQRSRVEFRDRLVIACPDPHVERWYMADPDSFHTVVGARPVVGKDKCQRNHYVQLLSTTVAAAGHPQTLGGIEWARDLVGGMDLYRAAKNDAALGHFLDDLRSKLRTLGRQL